MADKLKTFIFWLLFFSVIGTVYSSDSEIKLPSVCVSGIMYDADNSLAVVNGESLRQGEEINGIKVLKISESTVSFNYQGRVFEKRIGEGCITADLIYKKTSQMTKAISPIKQWATIKKPYSDKQAHIFPYTIFMAAAWLIVIVFYIYNSLCLHKIAAKTNTPHGWLAWLPILNIFLMLMIAGKSFWWLILLLIPLVNLICIIIIWMEIAKMCDKPAWLGLLMMLPFANFMILGYLAFSR